ncbi:hypothetical protein OG21DRAFT_1525436 [Imleria badia]|nr:hypothetical protein OG21DRAFT_1525436 [Imleria badia]
MSGSKKYGIIHHSTRSLRSTNRDSELSLRLVVTIEFYPASREPLLCGDIDSFCVTFGEQHSDCGEPWSTTLARTSSMAGIDQDEFHSRIAGSLRHARSSRAKRQGIERMLQT